MPSEDTVTSSSFLYLLGNRPGISPVRARLGPILKPSTSRPCDLVEASLASLPLSTATIYQWGRKTNLSLVYRQVHISWADDAKIQAKSVSCSSSFSFASHTQSSSSFSASHLLYPSPSLIPRLIQQKGQEIHKLFLLRVLLSTMGYG